MENLILMTDYGYYYFVRQCLSVILVMFLWPWQLPAQGQSPQQFPVPTKLKIYVLGGKDAVNFIPDHQGATPIVEVRDENELPVTGAAVEFILPETGPGGEFLNGKHTFSAVTNNEGQAEAFFTVRPEPGAFLIRVTATIDTRSGSAVIRQMNSLKASDAANATMKPHHWYKNWKILALAGAGVVALVVVLATRGGSGAGSGTAVGLTPGIPTFGAPH
jgi:hypothetical protein